MLTCPAAKGLNFDLNLHLHPYFVYASIHMRRLAPKLSLLADAFSTEIFFLFLFINRLHSNFNRMSPAVVEEKRKSRKNRKNRNKVDRK